MRNLLRNSIAFAPEGAEGAGGSETGSEGAESNAASSETILSGNVDNADGKGGEGNGDVNAGKEAPAWQEYVNDPKLSDEDNAKARAEHDKTKPAEADGKEKKDGKSEEVDPADLAPEDGKYDIQLEGDIKLDEALLEKAAPVMKDIGLTNRQASKLAGVLAEQRKAEFDALNERHSKIIKDWQTEIKTDKDFGGDNLKTSVKTADRVIATFGDDAFRRDLVELGIGNHPGLFRLLARVGNALSDDKPVTSETPAASVKSPEEAMYGATTPTTRG